MAKPVTCLIPHPDIYLNKLKAATFCHVNDRNIALQQNDSLRELINCNLTESE